MKNKLLIVVDVQNDFVFGPLGTKEAQEALQKIRKYVWEANEKGYQIIYTRDTHFPESYEMSLEGAKLPIMHCKSGSWGWQICDGVELFDKYPKHGDNIIRLFDKTTFGYDRWQENKYLEEFEAIEILGFCTDICVIANALLLRTFYPETSILVIEDCCAGTTPEKHKAAIEVMRSCMIDII